MTARVATARIVLAAILLSPSAASAISIRFELSPRVVGVGLPLDVALVLSGLGDGEAPSLSTFDLAVAFDDSILAFDTAAFGDPALGDQLDLFSLGSATDVTPGTGAVNLLELSFDLPSDLDTLQAPSFTLATITFTALVAGTSPLDLSTRALGDASGDPLTLDSVLVVPEPATAALLALAVTLTMALRRRRRRSVSALSCDRF